MSSEKEALELFEFRFHFSQQMLGPCHVVSCWELKITSRKYHVNDAEQCLGDVKRLCGINLANQSLLEPSNSFEKPSLEYQKPHQTASLHFRSSCNKKSSSYFLLMSTSFAWHLHFSKHGRPGTTLRKKDDNFLASQL